MASIFLSYAREDARKAQRVAEALERAGHSVWWDRQLHVGERFSAEIEAELRKADLVVVLWSRSSVESPWVSDEAAAGRDSGRLIPVLIDPVEPPLGFRQYHAIDLTRGLRGARTSHVLAQAIATKFSGATFKPATIRSTWPRFAFRWSWVALGVAAVLALGLALWLLRPAARADDHTVAVAAAGGDISRSRELARTIALDLGRYRTGSLGALTIIPGNEARAENAAFHVEVGVSGVGNDWRADLALRDGRRRSLLWTTSIGRKGPVLVDLRQQATSAIAQVLDCVGEVRLGKTRLRREALSLYLDGCGKLSDYNRDEPGADLLGVFRQLTRQAPDFAQGWARLALLEAQSFPSVPQQDWRRLAMAAREHLRRAKKIDADLPVVFLAEAYLPENYLTPGHALSIVEKGLVDFPESSSLHDARADFLSHVGRMGEAIKEAKAALDLAPLSPAQHDTYASALAYAGRTESAFEALRKAEAIWPGSTVLEQSRYRLDLRYGDPRNALRLLAKRGSGDARPVPTDDAWRRFLEARIDPSVAKIDKAVATFRERAKGIPGDWGYFQALGTFGRVDEAFKAMQSDEVIEGLGGSTNAFFRIHMRSIYSDARFMGVAHRLGLLPYWKKSAIWPDFCAEPQLPYDCRSEAAKYKD